MGEREAFVTGKVFTVVFHGALVAWDKLREFRLPRPVRERIAELRYRGAEVTIINDRRPLFLVAYEGYRGLLYGAATYGMRRDLPAVGRYREINTHCVAILDGQPLYWARGEDGWRVVHGDEEDRRRWKDVTVRGPVDGVPLAYASNGRRCQPYVGMTPLPAILPHVPFCQFVRDGVIRFDIADPDTGETTTTEVLFAS